MGKNLDRWRDQTHSIFPHYSVTDEHIKHVMTFPTNSATLCWLFRLKELEEWFRKHGLIPMLAEVVLYHLYEWIDSTFSEAPP